MHPLNDVCKELILEMENIDVGEGKLVEEDTTEVYGREERWKEVELLQKGGVHNQVPGWSDDGFSQYMLSLVHIVCRRGFCRDFGGFQEYSLYLFGHA